MTVDPLWPRISPYTYCDSNSITLRDPSGLKCEQRPCEGYGVSNACIALLCAVKSAREIYEIVETLGELAGAMTWKEMRKWLKDNRKLYSEDPRIGDPSECCKKTKLFHDHGGPWFPSKEEIVYLIIGALCDRKSLLGRAMVVDQKCVMGTSSFDGCYDCCISKFSGTNGEYTKVTHLCINRCLRNFAR